jgi:hypothetical protein
MRKERAMTRGSLTHALLASAMVLAAGTVPALAGAGPTGVVEDQKVVVDVNGTVATIGLADLADGESRQLAAGNHTVTVTRSGERLEVLLDGKGLLDGDPAASDEQVLTWAGEAGESSAETRRVVVVKDAAAAGATTQTVVIRTRTGEGDEELTVDVEAAGEDGASQVEELRGVGAGTVIFTAAEPGAAPVVVAAPGRRPGMVRYRCEATGSELLVAEEQATAESYVCPATGCVMARVAEPEVRVIKVIRKVETGGDSPTE